MYGPIPLSTTSQCNIVAKAGILRGASQAGLHSSLKLEQFFSIKQHSFPSLTIGKASECKQLGIAPSQKHLFDLERNNGIFTVEQCHGQTTSKFKDLQQIRLINFFFPVGCSTYFIDQNSQVT